MANRYRDFDQESQSSHRIKIKSPKPRNPYVDDLFAGGKFPPKKHQTKTKPPRHLSKKDWYDE